MVVGGLMLGDVGELEAPARREKGTAQRIRAERHGAHDLEGYLDDPTAIASR